MPIEQEIKRIAENMGLEKLKAYIAGVIQRSIAYDRKEFEAFISQTKFKDFEMKKNSMGFSIYLKK